MYHSFVFQSERDIMYHSFCFKKNLKELIAFLVMCHSRSRDRTLYNGVGYVETSFR